MAQTQLTTSRLLLHSGIFVFLAIYLYNLGVGWLQGFFIFAVFAFYELVYLTYIIINNMKQKRDGFEIVGKRVVITGGSSGIGFELAKICIKEECSKLVLVARNEERLKAKVAELKELSDSSEQNISCLALDLSSNGKEVADRFGRLGHVDLLINCAGFSIPGEFQDMDVGVFEEMMKANYLSSVHATHAVMEGMIEKKKGQIVFLSSVGGQLGVYGFTAYSASKYAVRGLAEVLYHELRPHGIGVSLAFPPDTKTPGFEKENEMKPKLCQMISEQAGLWSAADVAEVIKDGIVNRRFLIGFGSDGYFMNALAGGTVPPNSIFDFWVQNFLSPILRVYMLFLQNSWTNMIDNEISKQNPIGK